MLIAKRGWGWVGLDKFLKILGILREWHVDVGELMEVFLFLVNLIFCVKENIKTETIDTAGT